MLAEMWHLDSGTLVAICMLIGTALLLRLALRLSHRPVPKEPRLRVKGPHPGDEMSSCDEQLKELGLLPKDLGLVPVVFGEEVEPPKGPDPGPTYFCDEQPEKLGLSPGGFSEMWPKDADCGPDVLPGGLEMWLKDTHCGPDVLRDDDVLFLPDVFREPCSGDELVLRKGPINARKNESKRANKRAKKARKKRGEFSALPAHVTPKALNLAPASLDRPDLHGMLNYEMSVLECLEHGTTSVLGISGNRGMGKSILLKLLYTSIRSSSSRYRYVFFVEAGSGFTSDRLQVVLARYIGLGPMLAFPTVDRISKFLRDESFVLLIDDVCTSFNLAAAGLPMPLGPRQNIVFTTRDETICAEMGSARYNIRMESLGKDVAWDLFKYNVGAQVIDTNSDIKNIAMKMVAECRGIPEALCTIGSFMSTQKDVRQWRVAYEMLMVKRPINEIEEIDDEGYPRLDYFEHELGDSFFFTSSSLKERS